MKIASNKLIDLYKYYQTELVSNYETSEIEAIFDLVCEHFLNLSKSEVKQAYHSHINQSDVLNIYLLVKELKTNKPIQYILGEAWFYDLKFKVNAHTLIPRPETEELVDIIIRDLKKQSHLLNANFKILDIGTGSGCIPICLKKHLVHTTVCAIDISNEALEVAKFNAEKNNTLIEWSNLNILNEASWLDSSYSFVVSNPPYVKKLEAAKMDERVLQHEPHLALFVNEDDDIIFYKKIIQFCDKHLYSGGYLYFELNPLTSNQVKNYADEFKIFNFTEIMVDMSGKKRFLKAIRK